MGQLMAMNAVPLGDLMIRAKVTQPPSSQTPAAREPKRSRGRGPQGQGVAVSELIKAEPMAVGKLLSQAKGGKAAPVGLATELPKVLKSEPKAKGVPTVTVTLGPNGQPVAKLAPARPAVAATPLVTVAAAGQPESVTERRGTSVPPAVSRAPASAPAIEGEARLVIEKVGQELVFKPKGLVFSKVGSVAQVALGEGVNGLSLFVRDQGVVRLNQAVSELRSLRKGVTELYAVTNGKMYIVPLSVEDAGGDWELKVPDALVSLDGVFHGATSSALYPGLEPATAAAGKAGAGGPSLRDSVAETARSALEQSREANRFYAAKAEVSYQTVALQVIDERSVEGAGRIYPVANAEVRLIGTEFRARTDATGHLTIRDVPRGSRFLVRVDDPSGTFKPAMAELEARDGVTRLRVMRAFSFDTIQSLAQVSQHAALGSYCGTVLGEDGAFAEGIAVAADAAAEGPFYFNRYGFLDRAQRATGPDGRFCLFNVATGPASLSLYARGTHLASLPVSIFAGRHAEGDLALGTQAKLTTQLAAMATAHEQLSSDPGVAQAYKPIDMVDLIPLGTDEPLMQVGEGQIESSDPLTVSRGRLQAVTQAAEFEPVLYTYPAGATQAVTPLVPRGFIEDMSLYAQVTHDPTLGSVLVEYGHPAGLDAPVTMRLVDQDGRDVGDGWYFSDQPVTKAIFFNVPAGIYTMMVETQDRYWLSVDTLVVYNETMSFLRLGSQLRQRR